MNSLHLKKIPLDHVQWIAGQFKLPAAVVKITRLDFGNVNKSFVIHQDSVDEKFVLQRINSYVFSHPEKLIQNLRIISNHINNRLTSLSNLKNSRWEMIHLVSTNNGADYFRDDDSSIWRVFNFIDNATCFDKINSTSHAEEVGKAIGRFHSLVYDLDTKKLHDTLPGFHILPEYLTFFDSIVDGCDTLKYTDDIEYCLRFIQERRETASILENSKKEGILPVRVIHGDPKVSNIMIDNQSKKSIAVLDLDTVKPGLIHYDIGDSLRSACNILGEESISLNSISFDVKLCRYLLEGYLHEAVHFLTDNDYEYIYDAVRLITFELGLRFFTDHLAGDKYFNIIKHGQNLSRALVQFRLAESIEHKESQIRQVISEIKNG